MAALEVKMVPVVFWLFSALALKKTDDHRRSFIDEKDFRRLQKEADERDGKSKSLPPPDIK